MNRQASSPDMGDSLKVLRAGHVVGRADAAQINEMLSPDCHRRYKVLLVSDYFYPNLGGVEMHMFQLGQCLIERGHKVVVMSNTYSKERLGVRYVSNGMKVYHLPLLPFSS